ncbi:MULTISPECIES: FtsX-like permease family protein [unclassified Streptococcus]|uniref:FtsX-like permease family protein n=1 Tax=unclassified Streptococcus TaxID=2608887 RepID=UPI000A5B6B16|nr:MULTISPECIES: FtsX-like permease family protein [unclassified Streptococcus]
MWKMTRNLAWSNLLKNKRLYSPFALVTILSVALSYLFISLTFNPNLAQVYAGDAVVRVMNFGMVVVMLVVALTALYANSFVIKNRSKEFGLYSILGLEKKHLLLMTTMETMIFAAITVVFGLLLGVILDNLFYAILLKLMRMPVVLVSTFRLSTLVLVCLYFAAIFSLTSILNAGKLGLTTSLNLVRNQRRGEGKAGLFGWLFRPFWGLFS